MNTQFLQGLINPLLSGSPDPLSQPMPIGGSPLPLDTNFLSVLEGGMAEKNRLAEEKRAKMSEARDKYVSYARKMALAEMVAPEQKKQDPQEVLTAALMAITAQAMGARPEYARAGFDAFQGGRQGQINESNQQASNQAKMEFDRQQRETGFDASVAKMDYEQATSEFEQASKNLMSAEKAYQDWQIQEDEQAFEMGKLEQTLGSREKIAAITDDTKRFVAQLSSDDRRGKKGFDLGAEYKAYRDMGYTDEEAKAQVSADNNLAIAKTATDNALRPGRVKELEARVTKIYDDIKRNKYTSETARMNAVTNMKKWDGEIDTDREAALIEGALMETGIALVDREAQLAESKQMLADHKETLAAAEKLGDAGMIEKAKKSVEAWTDIVAVHNQRLTELKKTEIRQKAEKAAPKGRSSRGGQSSSRGSTDNHSAFRNKLAGAFPGAKVEQFSGTNRNMRGAGTTNKPSRHNDGRALDAYYKSSAEKSKMADWAIANGATFIIDYAGKRNWRKGQGWKPAPNNDPSYKHLHIEID